MQKRLIISFYILFTASLALPVMASFTDIWYGNLVGYIEIIIAFVIATLTITIRMNRVEKTKKHSRRLTISAYKAILNIPLILMVVYLVGINVRWEILLLGFGWRFWLLSLVLEDIVQSRPHPYHESSGR